MEKILGPHFGQSLKHVIRMVSEYHVNRQIWTSDLIYSALIYHQTIFCFHLRKQSYKLYLIVCLSPNLGVCPNFMFVLCKILWYNTGYNICRSHWCLYSLLTLLCDQMDKSIKSTCSNSIMLRNFPLLVVKSVPDR